MSEHEVLCEVNGVVVLARLSTGDLVAPEGLEGIAAYFDSGGIPEKVYEPMEPVGYRYRHDESEAWRFATLDDAVDDMRALAARGWQVERLYRRVGDDE